MGLAHHKVFLSHSRADTGVAKLLRHCLELMGGTTFLDVVDLPAGVTMRSKLIAEIRNSQEMLLLISPKFLESRWLDWELGVAEAISLPVVPILFGMTTTELTSHPKLRDYFLERYCIELGDIEAYLDQLQMRISEFATKQANTAGRGVVASRTRDGEEDVDGVTIEMYLEDARLELKESLERYEAARQLRNRKRNQG